MKRFVSLAASAALLAGVVASSPVSAQTGGGNGNGNNNNGSNSANASCTQATSGAGGQATGAPQANRGDSHGVLVGVIDALINANALNDTQVVANALNSSNLQVVCLNDVLNQNDLNLLNDVLSGDNILNNSLNGSLNEIAQNALQNADLALLNNVEVVTVNVGGGAPQIFLLRR